MVLVRACIRRLFRDHRDVGESIMVLSTTIRRTWEPWESWEDQEDKRCDGADAKGYVEELAILMVG